jgi:hypothetical protein
VKEWVGAWVGGWVDDGWMMWLCRWVDG